MKTFEALLTNNKITIQEYIEVNRQTSYEDHLEHARSKNRSPLSEKEYLAALFALRPELLPKKESKPAPSKKKSVKRTRKRKGDK